MKRRVEAIMSMFTDMIGPQTNKARALSVGEQQGQRAVVNSLKPTGVSVEALAPVTSPTHPSYRTASKLAFLLSPRSLGRARHGADDEHNVSTKADSNNRGSY